eukprot:1361489-Rhodomonas_salina.6
MLTLSRGMYHGDKQGAGRALENKKELEASERVQRGISLQLESPIRVAAARSRGKLGPDRDPSKLGIGSQLRPVILLLGEESEERRRRR